MALTLDACQARGNDGRPCGEINCAKHGLATKEHSFYSDRFGAWAIVQEARRNPVLLDIFPEIAELRDRHKEIDADHAAGKLTANQKHKLKNEMAMLVFRGMESRERIVQLRREKLTHSQLRQIFRDLFAVVQREVRDPVLRANIGRRMSQLINPGRRLPAELEAANKAQQRGGLAEKIEHRANSGIVPSGDDELAGDEARADSDG